jgi:hypothetical protein
MASANMAANASAKIMKPIMAASLSGSTGRGTGPLDFEGKPPENAGLIDKDLVTAGADRNAQTRRRAERTLLDPELSQKKV